jgi:hypothetical protein
MANFFRDDPLLRFLKCDIARPDPRAFDKLRDAIERVTPQKFREVSLKIFEKGFLEGQKSIKP